MYTKFWWLVVAAILLFAPAITHAHNPGEPAVVRINDSEVLHNPVNFSSLPDLALTEELAPVPYLVNSKLRFTLNESVVPLLPEHFSLYTFSWDFGDNQRATGAAIEHAYATAGTYTATASMQKADGSEASITLASVRLHIVPSDSYTLPEPIITVNGTPTKDSITDSIPAAFTKRVILDASKSRAGSAKIINYTWDLGNRKMARDARVNVTYENLFSTVQPVVRITDANNLSVDATVELTNVTLPNADGSIPTTSEQNFRWLSLLGAILFVTLPTLLLRYLKHH